MIRSIFTRSVLAASLCVLASAQSAFASSLQSMDVNDTHTKAGRAAKALAKLEGCPLSGDKSSRFTVASAKTEAGSVISDSDSRGGDVRR